MKNPVRNVVVEYKNKRARKANVSLWGDLDLKTIAREVAAETLQPAVTARAETDLLEPPANEVEFNDNDISSQTETPTRMAEGKPKPFSHRTVVSERAMIAPTPVLKPETLKGIVARPDKRSSKRELKKRTPQKTKAVTRSDEMTDICAELSFFEKENAILRSKLIARLRAENEKLVSMLQKAQARTTTNN